MRLSRHKWKLGYLIPFVILALWLSARWTGTYLPAVVAKERKSYASGINRQFGYSIGKYRWQTNGFEVNIWGGSTLEIRLAVPYFELIRVREQRWLAQDRVVLLRFDYVYHDSVDTSGEMGVLYDFERGELHSYGGAWHVWTPEERRDRYMSKEQFETLVHQLETISASPVKQ